VQTCTKTHIHVPNTGPKEASHNAHCKSNEGPVVTGKVPTKAGYWCWTIKINLICIMARPPNAHTCVVIHQSSLYKQFTPCSNNNQSIWSWATKLKAWSVGQSPYQVVSTWAFHHAHRRTHSRSHRSNHHSLSQRCLA